ncbi:MAG: hypothetical protein HY289_08635, partial [Planctomycetes bacterium]|nr:hypothetical protein [Planctomycetota bacterium]
MTRRYDDDFDVRDDDFNERELRRRRRRRKVARAEALLAPPAIALMAVSVLSLVVLTVYCPYNIFVTMTEPRFQGDQAFNVGRYTGALFCVPLFMLSHLVVGISGFLMYTRKS